MIIKIIFVFSAILAMMYFFSAKIKQKRFSKESESGNIKVLDGMLLDNNTSAYLLSVEGEKLFLVSGNNGMQLRDLKSKNLRFNFPNIEEKVEESLVE